ncbi:MAG: hypothetical protein M3396_02170 [Actinomycetota bacterium]|nr:hypothetical protein [Actinomycetota bacterium]
MSTKGERKVASGLVLVILLSAAGLGLTVCGGRSEPQRAVPFESSEGRFKVDFPGTPERQEQTEPSGGQSPKVTVFSVETKDEAYSVAFSDLPTPGSQLDPSVVLDAVPEGSAARVPGTVRSKTSSSFLGSPAVDYVIDGEGRSKEVVVQARAILVGRRLYILQGAGKSTETPFYDRMLASFRLLSG